MRQLLIAIILPLFLFAGCSTVKGAFQGGKTGAATDYEKAIAKAEKDASKASAAAGDDPVKQTELQAKLTSDLTQAIAEAQTATDPVAPLRVTCYQTVLSLVPNIPSIGGQAGKGPSGGIFTTFERGAELAENTATVAEFQIPPEVRVQLLKDCGPVGQAARDLLLKFNLRLARIAGRVALIPK